MMAKLTIFLLLFLIQYSRAAHFKVTEQVYFDISKEGEPLGRVVIGLFGEVAPKTVENFKEIATIGINGKTYAGTKIHRIIKRFMIQGGDIVHNNGSGSISIFGPEFEDENLEMTYEISGLISMANRGKDSNGCQFFINTIPTPWLNGQHTIFGKVVEGQNIVHIIEHISTDVDDRPTYEVIIDACGEIDTPKPFFVSDQPYDIWAWLRASAVPLTMSFSILGFFQWVIRKIEM
ncbi:peptidyl-prolyl cis-trans isomerase, rhodopsin-specific isozyme-like [Arctopsyche grandis]|uniref:peptidyl-prolyl cis-trans isomerase, rhodopsin-specific isozyme-like n=1 Tax=Arctopsyche grandis TaxID=121162 RepID=UPI00406D895B